MLESKSDNKRYYTVDQLLTEHPASMRVFVRHGMACIGCPMARFETVAEVVDAYHLDVDSFIKEVAMASRRSHDDDLS